MLVHLLLRASSYLVLECSALLPCRMASLLEIIEEITLKEERERLAPPDLSESIYKSVGVLVHLERPSWSCPRSVSRERVFQKID